METLQAGWLIKSPPERRPWNILKQQWKKRYFVLCQLFTSTHKSDHLQLALEYYDSDSKCCKKGKIDLENCDDIQSGLRCPPHDYVFSMRTKHRGQSRIYYLAAESFEEMDRWVQSLCTVLNHGRPASQCLRQVPAISAYDFGTYNERMRKPDTFSGRRSSFHCSRASCRPFSSRDQIRNNSSDIGLAANTQSSFLDSMESTNFTAPQQTSDCYIALGECYSGTRKEKRTTASDDGFFSSGRYGSLKRNKDRNNTIDRNSTRHSRESRSYSNLTGEYFKTMPNFRPLRNRQAPSSRPHAILSRQQVTLLPTNFNRLAVPSRALATKTVFLNNSFASSRPFLEPDRSYYINTTWEKNSKTVPLHPRQNFEVQRNSRWYERRNEVQLPIKSYNRSFESGSSCDEGDDESSPSTFNEYPSYLHKNRGQPCLPYPPCRHQPHQHPHHISLHYLDLDLDSCHLEEINDSMKWRERDRGRHASRSSRDVTQYCQIDFCKTKGLQDTRIDVESERKNSDRSVENNASNPSFSNF